MRAVSSRTIASSQPRHPHPALSRHPLPEQTCPNYDYHNAGDAGGTQVPVAVTNGDLVCVCAIPRLGARPSNGELEGRERETDRHGVNSMRVFILR